MAIGKQHKERFYHFQDNRPAESESGVPFSAAAEEGGGAAQGERTSVTRAGLLGGKREQLCREVWALLLLGRFRSLLGASQRWAGDEERGSDTPHR